MELEKFQVYNLSDLSEGDRFYFAGSKWNICDFITTNKGRFESENQYSWKNSNNKEYKSSKNRQVVFLRHSE